MSSNTFGKLFRFTTWGESHGPAIGCVIDGCPPNIQLNEKEIFMPGNEKSYELLLVVTVREGGGLGDRAGGVCRVSLLGATSSYTTLHYTWSYIELHGATLHMELHRATHV